MSKLQAFRNPKTRVVMLLLCLFGSAGAAFAVGSAGPGHWMVFTMDRPGAPVTHYTINLQMETGSGWYQEGSADAPKVPISASAGTMQRVFAIKDHLRNCGTHLKNIANTGDKTLTYQNGDETVECKFNYSDRDKVNDAAAVFEAIAETMQEGSRLEKLHRFDRLGLDAEVDTFLSEVKEGRAVEVENIAPALTSLVNDDNVIDRVRRKAARLLQDAGVPVAAADSSASAAISPR